MRPHYARSHLRLPIWIPRQTPGVMTTASAAGVVAAVAATLASFHSMVSCCLMSAAFCRQSASSPDLWGTRNRQPFSELPVCLLTRANRPTNNQTNKQTDEQTKGPLKKKEKRKTKTRQSLTKQKRRPLLYTVLCAFGPLLPPTACCPEALLCLSRA